MSWLLFLALLQPIDPIDSIASVDRAADPRPSLVQQQLEHGYQAALDATETLIAQRPQVADDLGLQYLRGVLLEQLGLHRKAVDAFSTLLGPDNSLEPFSRRRVALNLERLGHPEVAAGLAATLLGDHPPQELIPATTDLLTRTLLDGGDCRLVMTLDTSAFEPAEQRKLELARSRCLLHQGVRHEAMQRLQVLLQQSDEDETARQAAVLLHTLVDSGDYELIRLVGMTLHRHRQFETSTKLLERVVANRFQAERSTRPTLQELETRYALARGLFWLRRYEEAAGEFASLAGRSGKPLWEAQALYQRGRCLELVGNWSEASDSFRRAYLKDPSGRWADGGLTSALRVEWRRGQETSALQLYEVLASQNRWRRIRVRAALFLASSDIARGRTDRATGWLSRLPHDPEAAIERAYWEARLALLDRDPVRAVDRFLSVLRRDRTHPVAQWAVEHLRKPLLAGKALERGLALSQSATSRDLYDAWLLLGDEHPAGAAARKKILQHLARQRSSRPYVDLGFVPPADWTLWGTDLQSPQERLLALGVWPEAITTLSRHFPLSRPALAFTASKILAQAGETRQAVLRAETLARRVPADYPRSFLPLEFRQLLFPLRYGEEIQRQAQHFGQDPFLLAALVREESRFDPQAFSAASARGLTQFVLPTAKRLARKIGLGNLVAADLHHPATSLTLGAAYLEELAQKFDHRPEQIIAAYNAGEDQAELWRSYCYSRDPAEYYSKIGFPETRGHVRKVLASHMQYAELYSPSAAASGGN